MIVGGLWRVWTIQFHFLLLITPAMASWFVLLRSSLFVNLLGHHQCCACLPLQAEHNVWTNKQTNKQIKIIICQVLNVFMFSLFAFDPVWSFLLTGLIRQGVRCKACKMSVHHKCRDNVPYCPGDRVSIVLPYWPGEVAFCFGFASDWLSRWHKFFKAMIKRCEAKPIKKQFRITFDAQLKICSNWHVVVSLTVLKGTVTSYTAQSGGWLRWSSLQWCRWFPHPTPS